MEIRTLICSFIGLTIFTTGCNKAEIGINSGSGLMIYEGISYSLHFLTAFTFSSDEGYRHSVTITGTEDRSRIFSFSIKDAHSQNEIAPGHYKITLYGDHTARFTIGDMTDSLTGIMKVTVSEGDYLFNFEGTTVNENSHSGKVVFTYKGKLQNENEPD
jgi:hypothetical protein